MDVIGLTLDFVSAFCGAALFVQIDRKHRDNLSRLKAAGIPPPAKEPDIIMPSNYWARTMPLPVDDKAEALYVNAVAYNMGCQHMLKEEEKARAVFESGFGLAEALKVANPPNTEAARRATHDYLEARKAGGVDAICLRAAIEMAADTSQSPEDQEKAYATLIKLLHGKGREASLDVLFDARDNGKEELDAMVNAQYRRQLANRAAEAAYRELPDHKVGDTIDCAPGEDE